MGIKEGQKDPAVVCFDQFLHASTLRGVMNTFHQLCDLLRINQKDYANFYWNLRSKLTSWKAKSLWAKLDKRAMQKEYKRGTACEGTRALVIGGGPCGLRMAIEVVLMGGKCVVLEKRDRYSRNNVLHLWPYLIHDLKALGAKKLYGKFCAGAIDHISIRQLQCILLKVALLFGVEVHINTSFEGLLEPCEEVNKEKVGWRVEVHPKDHPVSEYEFDVLIGADGKRNTLDGFKRKEFRGKLAIGITANFINWNTNEEASVEEISGVAFIFNQKFFKDLKDETGIDLENIVYYKDETHYFVMTAKKQSLLAKGVLLTDQPDVAKLLSRENINQEALLGYAKEAADVSTSHQLPVLEYAKNHFGQADVAMFDFTSLFQAENACRIVQRHGFKLLVGLVGDSLLEPFWPTGSGCARGFLGCMDAAWMIRSFASGVMTPLEVIAERESIYQLLSQATPENLSKDFSQYTVDPRTRYPNLSIGFFKPHQCQYLFDCDDDAYMHEIVSIPIGRRKSIDFVGDYDRMLKWYQKQLDSYKDLVKVSDLSSSWKNGKAFCALIHHFRPDLINIEDLPTDHECICRKAFDILENEFGIPPIMTAHDMADSLKADKLSLWSYLSQIFDCFKTDKLNTSRSPDSLTSDEAASLRRGTPSQRMHLFSRINKMHRRSRERRDKENEPRGKPVERYSPIFTHKALSRKRFRDLPEEDGGGHDIDDTLADAKRTLETTPGNMEPGVRGQNKVSDLADRLFVNPPEYRKVDLPESKGIGFVTDMREKLFGAQKSEEPSCGISQEELDQLGLQMKRGTAPTSYIGSFHQQLFGEGKEEERPPLQQQQKKNIPGAGGLVSTLLNMQTKNMNCDVCYFCQKRVYVMERISAEGFFFHRGCLRCDYCGTVLRLGNYAFKKNDAGEDKFYCFQHLGMQKKVTRKRLSAEERKKNLEEVKAKIAAISPKPPVCRPVFPPFRPEGRITTPKAPTLDTLDGGIPFNPTTPERVEFENSLDDVEGLEEIEVVESLRESLSSRGGVGSSEEESSEGESSSDDDDDDDDEDLDISSLDEEEYPETWEEACRLADSLKKKREEESDEGTESEDIDDDSDEYEGEEEEEEDEEEQTQEVKKPERKEQETKSTLKPPTQSPQKQTTPTAAAKASFFGQTSEPVRIDPWSFFRRSGLANEQKQEETVEDEKKEEEAEPGVEIVDVDLGAEEEEEEMSPEDKDIEVKDEEEEYLESEEEEEEGAEDLEEEADDLEGEADDLEREADDREEFEEKMEQDETDVNDLKKEQAVTIVVREASPEKVEEGEVESENQMEISEKEESESDHSTEREVSTERELSTEREISVERTVESVAKKTVLEPVETEQRGLEAELGLDVSEKAELESEICEEPKIGFEPMETEDTAVEESKINDVKDSDTDASKAEMMGKFDELISDMDREMVSATDEVDLVAGGERINEQASEVTVPYDTDVMTAILRETCKLNEPEQDFVDSGTIGANNDQNNLESIPPESIIINVDEMFVTTREKKKRKNVDSDSSFTLSTPGSSVIDLRGVRNSQDSAMGRDDDEISYLIQNRSSVEFDDESTLGSDELGASNRAMNITDIVEVLDQQNREYESKTEGEKLKPLDLDTTLENVDHLEQKSPMATDVAPIDEPSPAVCIVEMDKSLTPPIADVKKALLFDESKRESTQSYATPKSTNTSKNDSIYETPPESTDTSPAAKRKEMTDRYMTPILEAYRKPRTSTSPSLGLSRDNKPIVMRDYTIKSRSSLDKKRDSGATGDVSDALKILLGGVAGGTNATAKPKTKISVDKSLLENDLGTKSRYPDTGQFEVEKGKVKVHAYKSNIEQTPKKLTSPESSQPPDKFFTPMTSVKAKHEKLNLGLEGSGTGDVRKKLLPELPGPSSDKASPTEDVFVKPPVPPPSAKKDGPFSADELRKQKETEREKIREQARERARKKSDAELGVGSEFTPRKISRSSSQSQSDSESLPNSRCSSVSPSKEKVSLLSNVEDKWPSTNKEVSKERPQLRWPGAGAKVDGGATEEKPSNNEPSSPERASIQKDAKRPSSLDMTDVKPKEGASTPGTKASPGAATSPVGNFSRNDPKRNSRKLSNEVFAPDVIKSDIKLESDDDSGKLSPKSDESAKESASNDEAILRKTPRRSQAFRITSQKNRSSFLAEFDDDSDLNMNSPDKSVNDVPASPLSATPDMTPKTSKHNTLERLKSQDGTSSASDVDSRSGTPSTSTSDSRTFKKFKEFRKKEKKKSIKGPEELGAVGGVEKTDEADDKSTKKDRKKGLLDFLKSSPKSPETKSPKKEKKKDRKSVDGASKMKLKTPKSKEKKEKRKQLQREFESEGSILDRVREMNLSEQSLKNLTSIPTASQETLSEVESEGKKTNHEKKVQQAARRQQRQRQLKRLRMAQEIQRQLEEIEVKQKQMEDRGVIVEQALRGEGPESHKPEKDLMQEWFNLIHEKNALVRYESELMITARELELEDRHGRLEDTLRERMSNPDAEKTEKETTEEKKILDELLEVVNQRNSLVALLEEDRLKYKKEDENLESVMTQKGFQLSPISYTTKSIRAQFGYS